MDFHRLRARLTGLVVLLIFTMAGCEGPGDEDVEAERFQECTNVSSEAVCQACCERNGAMDHSFDALGDPPCRCIPVP